MTHGSLFSGIGGFDLAAEWMGWQNVFHCEWNEFGQKVLKHYWPKAISYEDITKTDFTIHRGRIDILTGGFPCQPYSMAGKRKGKEDERHLWPEMLRAIREIQPRWVVGENVFGLVNWSEGLVFHEVQTDLETEGYEVFPYVLNAASVGAPHKRDRIWFVAFNSKSKRNSEVGRICERKNNESFGVCRKDKEWNASHPNCIRLQQCENETKMGGGQEEMGRQGSEFANATQTNGTISNAPHPNGNGFKRSDCQHEINASERGVNAFGDIEQVGESNVNNSNSIGRGKIGNEGGNVDDGKRKWKFGTTNCTPNWWGEFPTQSPICTGNDGISTRLDGITFSKWRNESIKAAGNAIVPQVVYQIFKAIEQYEKQTT